MLCSNTVLFLTTLSLVGTCMYVVCGWFALDGTLSLFDEYGPDEGSGNPAKDQGPNYYVNPTTGKWGPVNSDKRGNLVPQVFKGIQHYLLALGIFMVFNTIIFLLDNVRSRRADRSRDYPGTLNSHMSTRCAFGLTCYLAFLSLMWLVMVCFGVVPLVEWVITMQRCADLDYPNWGQGTTQAICVDLVQYGLVFFQESRKAGFGLICGAGGRYAFGDLEGFCQNYYPNFNLYLTSFIGACIVLITTVLFAMRYVSNFAQLNMRKLEKELAANPDAHGPHLLPHKGYVDPRVHYYGNSMHNPNYEHNAMLLGPTRMPNDADAGSFGKRSPAQDSFETKEPFYDSGEEVDHKSEKSYSRSSQAQEETSFQKEAFERVSGHRRPSAASVETPRPRGCDSDLGRRRSQNRNGAKKHPFLPSSESEDIPKKPTKANSRDRCDFSDHNRSTIGYRPQPLKRKPRGTKSDPDISRQSRKSGRRSAQKQPSILDEEYDSPPSDFYIQEDLQRRTHSRKKNRTKSAL